VPTVSIITAVYAPSAAYLAESIDGVAGQALPAGWHLEWMVQEDATEPSLADRFAGLDYVRYAANGVHLGIPGTRNLALAAATGDLVQVLDADDILLPGALASLIPKFQDERIHWAVGQADDLRPDGTRVHWESALPYGTIPAGAVNVWAESHGGNWPIHGAGLMLRSTSLRALGGWAGLPVDEDLGMFAALSEIAAGHNFDGVTWLYRQHPNQTTRSGARRHLSEAGRRFALQRARAVRFADLNFGPKAEFAFGQRTHEVCVGPAAKEPSPLDTLDRVDALERRSMGRDRQGGA
jgi:glycosyltransferase involved in cell wall biosynthesis